MDATLGAGGHSERFLTDFPGLQVIGLDRDPNALGIAGARLAPVRRPDAPGADPLRRNRRARSRNPVHRQIDGVLFDLGVSSMQLDQTERGFSYSADAPLDMRMDPDAPADRRRHPQHL